MTNSGLRSSASANVVLYTDKASTAVRAAALGLIAASWFFMQEASKSSAAQAAERAMAAAQATCDEAVEPTALPRWLLAGMMLAVACLLVDAVQYAYGAWAYSRYARTIELTLDEGSQIIATPKQIKAAWRRARRNGTVAVILESVGIDPEEFAECPAEGERVARAVLAQAYAYKRDPSSKRQWELARPKPKVKQLQQVWAFLDGEWSTRRVTGTIAALFWAKVFLILGSTVAVGVYAVSLF